MLCIYVNFVYTCGGYPSLVWIPIVFGSCGHFIATLFHLSKHCPAVLLSPELSKRLKLLLSGFKYDSYELQQ